MKKEKRPKFGLRRLTEIQLTSTQIKEINVLDYLKISFWGKGEVVESGLRRWTETPVDIHPDVTWVRMFN